MEDNSGNQKKPSIVYPNRDEIGQIIYPPEAHNHYDGLPPGSVVQRIPINSVIGIESVTGYCYNCNDYRTTKVSKKVGNKIWGCVCLLFFIFPILSPIPFCISSCYDTGHTCPECKKLMARYKVSS